MVIYFAYFLTKDVMLYRIHSIYILWNSTDRLGKKHPEFGGMDSLQKGKTEGNLCREVS